MGLRHWLAVVAIALALGVLGFLLHKTRSLDADPAQAALIASLAQADVAVDEALKRSLSGMSEPLDPLTQATAALAAVRARLATQLPAAFKRSAAPALEQLQDKLNRLDEYAQQRAQFQGQWLQLQELQRDVQSAAATAKLQPALAELAQESLNYVQVAAPDNGPRLIKLIAQIKSGADLAGGGQADLERLADTAVAALSAKDRSQAVANRLAKLQAASPVKALGQAHARQLAAAQAEAARYRVILSVYTVALLTAFGLIGLRLRMSLGELDRANTELQHTNANLEKIVEQRTEDLRRAMSELRQQQAQLIQSEKMASLGQMVAGVAHEINTPLGYATSNVGTVRESLDGIGAAGDTDAISDLKLLLQDAEYGLGQIAELVMSLKNFSRVDRSRTDLFDVNEGLDTALKICGGQLKGRVEVEREYGTLPKIPCAPSQLNQVFLNLLNNAGQAIEGEGTIRIRTRDSGEQIEIGIRDSGCGMDEGTRARIFEPFFTTKDVGQGQGLGLTIAYRIIEDHRGQISVESAPGRGTEFTIVLPKKSAAAAATSA